MKLAEALIIRADLQNKLAQISNRIMLNSKYQEGEKPDEDPLELLKQYSAVLDELKGYIVSINNTNCKSIINGVSIMEMIASRDAMMKKVHVLQELSSSAGERVNRYSQSEIKIFASVNVAEIQKQADELSKKIRETDTKLQELNWTTELIK